MKLLLVLDSEDSYNIIARCVRPLGFELIRYRQVLKAMDNIDEINPTAVVISASDFPRHWKILVQFVRGDRPKEMCPIIVFKGSHFSVEEGAQALFLGVSGLVDESLDNPSELIRLQNILSRYIPVNERRRYNRLHVERWHRLGFLFVNPANQAIITGDLKTISIGGISFLPSFSSLMQDIVLDMQLDECSLRIGSSTLSPICRLVRGGRIISIEFSSFPGDEQKILEQYLIELPLLDYKVKQGAEG
jgi:hypothetical protein